MIANLVYAVLFALVLAPATAFLRWQFGKSHWPSYPGGSRAHFFDCLNASVGLFPICAGCVVYSFMPTGQQRTVITIGLFAAGIVYGLTPSARRSNLRLIQARLDGKPQ